MKIERGVIIKFHLSQHYFDSNKYHIGVIESSPDADGDFLLYGFDTKLTYQVNIDGEIFQSFELFDLSIGYIDG